MKQDVAIELSNVWKGFPHRGSSLIRNRIAQRKRGEEPERVYALKDVCLQVRRGDSVAVIGANGAGKSTLLRLMTGLMRPERGRIVVRGQIAALLELGATFHPDLTGAENLRLNAALIGLSRRRTDEIYDSIVEFAEIRDFIHEPLRTYSSGMAMRLAFAVAVHGDPDILVIDEVLAVGDQAFQDKCIQRMEMFKRTGRTIFCASHDIGLVERLCDRVVWLDHGRLIMDGAVDAVIHAYQARAGRITDPSVL